MNATEPARAPKLLSESNEVPRLVPDLQAEVFPAGVAICAAALCGAMVTLHTIFHVLYFFKGADWRHPGQYLPALLMISMLSFVWAIVSLLSPNAWVESGILQDRYRNANRFIWLGFMMLLIGIMYAIAISVDPVREALRTVLPQFQWMSMPK